MASQKKDQPEVMGQVTRVGLTLFWVYFVMFAGFLLLNVFDASAMRDTVIPLPRERYLDLHGLNLSLVYGLFLILAAMVLAIVYLRKTRPGRHS